MKEIAFKSFVRQTYNSSSPLPYVLTIIIALFVLLKIIGTLNLSGSHSIIALLSLPALITQWGVQPWSLLTYSFVYTEIFSLIFDCLWLFWISSLVLNLLRVKQFLFIFLGGIIYGGIMFLLLNTIPLLAHTSLPLTSMTNGIGALIGAMLLLSPKTEIRLALFGLLKLRTIALLYFGVELLSLCYKEQYAAAIAFLLAIGTGLLFIISSRKGNNTNQDTRQKTNKHLKIIHKQNKAERKIDNLNQEIIDELLDKISAFGYESLSQAEKQILFKASKKD